MLRKTFCEYPQRVLKKFVTSFRNERSERVKKSTNKRGISLRLLADRNDVFLILGLEADTQETYNIIQKIKASDRPERS